ncbi:MAG: hypothetical protein ABII09_01175 [Planctomycetota bacterium]
MSHIPQTAENLVRIGANVIISKEANYIPQSLENIVRIASNTGAHVTIYGEKQIPQTLENLARIGGKNITIVI